MNVDLSKIPYFLAAAEHLNFTEAANQCYVTQSSLSKSIASLEASLGFPLFIRGNRKISLTAEGAYLYQEFSKYSVAVDEAIDNALNIRSGVSGGFTIASCGYLPENMRFKLSTSGFFLSNPMFRMEIVQASYPGLREVLIDDKADAILTGSQNISLIKNIDYITIAGSRPVLLCNPFFYHMYKERPGILGFTHAKFVATRNSPDYQTYLSGCCHCYGFKPDVTYVDSLMEVIYYVSNMNYVTILDGVQYPVENTSLNVIDIPERPGIPKIDLMLVWKNNNQNPALRHYTEYLRSEVEREEQEEQD